VTTVAGLVETRHVLCPICGKRGWVSRRQARKANRTNHHRLRLYIYICGATGHVTKRDA
jgi:hypothetical protein